MTRTVDPTLEIKKQFKPAFKNIDKALRAALLKQLSGEWPEAIVTAIVAEDEKGDLQVMIRVEEHHKK